MSVLLRRVPREPACFMLVATAWVTYLLLAGDDRFYHDSARYWRLGELFGRARISRFSRTTTRTADTRFRLRTMG